MPDILAAWDDAGYGAPTVEERYVRQGLIKPLLESGRLVQTIPDKPSSPNQRYMKAR